MDLNFKKWHWTQWIMIPALIFYFHGSFSGKFFYIKQLGLNTTLFVLASMAMTLFNVSAVYGSMIDLKLKKCLIFNAIPLILILVSLIFLAIVSMSFPVNIILPTYLKMLGKSLLVAVVCVLFNLTNEVLLIPENELNYKED